MPNLAQLLRDVRTAFPSPAHSGAWDMHPTLVQRVRHPTTLQASAYAVIPCRSVGQQSGRPNITCAPETVLLQLAHVSRGGAAAHEIFSDLEADIHIPIRAVNTPQDFAAAYQNRSIVMDSVDPEATDGARLFSGCFGPYAGTAIPEGSVLC